MMNRTPENHPIKAIMLVVMALSLITAACGSDASDDVDNDVAPVTTSAAEDAPVAPVGDEEPIVRAEIEQEPATTTAVKEEQAEIADETADVQEEPPMDELPEEPAPTPTASETVEPEDETESLPSATVEPSDSATSAWVSNSYTDDIGQDTEILGVLDTEPSGIIFDPPILLVVCLDGTDWQVQVNWGTLLPAPDRDTGRQEIQYHFGDDVWLTDYGYSATDFSSWFASDPEEFVSTILDQDALMWRPVDRDEGPVDNVAVFPVAGLRDELADLSCVLT